MHMTSLRNKRRPHELLWHPNETVPELPYRCCAESLERPCLLVDFLLSSHAVPESCCPSQSNPVKHPNSKNTISSPCHCCVANRGLQSTEDRVRDTGCPC